MISLRKWCFAWMALCLPAALWAAERPNILLIVAEDMSPRVGAFGDPIAQTPAIDALARQGVRYTHVFTAAGVCAPNRSALITGVQPISLGTHQMRTAQGPIPYETVTPVDVKAFPELLRRVGYATVNVAKTDYQFGEPFSVWDVNLGNFAAPPDLAAWRQLPDGKPFFAMINLMSTHESRLASAEIELPGDHPFKKMVEGLAKWQAANVERVTNPADVVVPPYYPDTPQVRQSIAQHYDNIHYMDSEVRQILENLTADGLDQNTVVIWTTDHGDGLPRAKRSNYDTGLHVPLIVRWPDGHGAGSESGQMLSFVDIAPSLLRIAGAPVPDFIEGIDVLGGAQREYIHAARDRMDETYDRQRTVRDSRFKYIRNLMPELAYFRPLAFRDMFPVMQSWWDGLEHDSLSAIQRAYFEAPRAPEELYDTQADPWEINNLADDPNYVAALTRLRAEADRWLAGVDDWGADEERARVWQMWPDGAQPTTADPIIALNRKSAVAMVSSETAGASIEYRLVTDGEPEAWSIYTGDVAINPGQSIEARAIRYGYAPSGISRAE